METHSAARFEDSAVMEGFATWQVLAILVAGLGVLTVVVLVRGLLFACRQLEATTAAAILLHKTAGLDAPNLEQQMRGCSRGS